MNLSMHRPITRKEFIRPNYNEISVDADDVEKMPCIGCVDKSYCAKEQKACLAYRAYLTRPYATKEQIDAKCRIPTAEIFDGIAGKKRLRAKNPKKQTNLTPCQAVIMEIISQHSEVGIIRQEIEAITGWANNTVGARSSELKRNFLVVEKGERRSSVSGRFQKILFPVEQ